MRNFTYENPTRILFGKETLSLLPSQLPNNANILLAYGGGSIKNNGVYDQVTARLEGYKTIEFSGIDANPKYEQLLPALDLIRKEQINFLLAVGGGSVVDAVKFLAAATCYDGDAWDILTGKHRVLEALPIGVILTLPGTGTESNGNSVISRIQPPQKLAFASKAVFPRWSILDPETTYSLPEKQVANGIADAFTHVLEQYLTFPVGGIVQDRMAEAVLHTLIDVAPKALQNNDYEARANWMWASTLALNTQLSLGVPGDWSTHQIGHEITALHGIDHARTLAIVLPSLLREQKASKREKLLQFGQRIWNIPIDNTEAGIEATIQQLEQFYHSLGIGTRFSDYQVDASSTATAVAQRLAERGAIALGEHRDITPEKVERILQAAA